jgi:DNA-binding MarR family transcriptional regulator
MNYSKFNHHDIITDTIASDAYRALHLLHRHLVNLPGFNILHHDLAILNILVQNGPLPTSEIASRLSLTKPQMPHFIDRLVEQDSVSREDDPVDRRRILVNITEKGKFVLAEYRKMVRNNISEKLKALDPEQVDILAQALARIIDITQKLS